MAERRVVVRETDDVTLASRVCVDVAGLLGACTISLQRLDLVIRELCWNLVRHAGGGIIHLQGLQQQGRHGVVISSQDCGSGIASLPLHYRLQPTSNEGATGGLGLGLAAVQRNSNEFSLQTAPQGGTFIRAVIWWPSKSS